MVALLFSSFAFNMAGGINADEKVNYRDLISSCITSFVTFHFGLVTKLSIEQWRKLNNHLKKEVKQLHKSGAVPLWCESKADQTLV